jgi:hypothetical protein
VTPGGLDMRLIVAVEHDHGALVPVERRRFGAIDQKPDRRGVGVVGTGGQEHRLIAGVRLAIGAVADEGIVTPRPKMLVERIAALLASGLDNHRPAARQGPFEEAGQGIIEGRIGQVVEQDFRHAS